jgi:uncharacterized protein YecE (DUF72 family)
LLWLTVGLIRNPCQNLVVAGTLYLGTSGFAYPEWKGAFYPDDVKDSDFLPHYATRFPSVEINYTFRRFPAEKTMHRWAGLAPEGFRFALKANQRITHTRRLRDADQDVGDFLDRARLLGSRLGPILFQCPPTLHFDRGLIESFLGYLPPIGPYAMEFRHESWNEAKPILRDNGVAWCVSETDERSAGDVPTEPFVYLRLRKEEYGDEDLKRWSEIVGSARAEERDVYAFFKHEEGIAAPQHAQRLAELVS